jgi:phosphotriesterase-related protein
VVLDVLGRPLRAGGAVLFHEHVQFGWPGFQLDPLARRGADPDEAARALDELADAGYGALVDATPIECGRDLALLAAVARRTRLQIVAATGLYERERGYPLHFASLSAQDLADLYTRDLSAADGRGQAGVIKVATGPPPFARRERRALEAAGMVSRARDVPVISHAESLVTAWAQLEILTEAGARPERIVLGHLDDEWRDPDGLAALIAAGAYVGIDRFGHTARLPDERRVELLAALHARGLLRRVLISHDAPLVFLGRISVGTPGRNPFLHIHTRVVPRLPAAGFAPADVDRLLQDNPTAFLA